MLEMRVQTFDMVLCLSRAIDLISPSLVNHHCRVAYVAYCLATELGLSAEQRNDLLIAGALHDIGALSLNDRMLSLAFEADYEALDPHARLGALMVSGFPAFSTAASLIRHHHLHWNKKEVQAPLGSHIIHLADRIAVMTQDDDLILKQVPDILDKVKSQSGLMFSPDLVSVFHRLAERESFWLDMTSGSLDTILSELAPLGPMELDMVQVIDLALLFSKIIDFRSPFTATHTRGVAALAETLTKKFSFSTQEVNLMKAAGYLHDLGKLAVPPAILDKPDRLTREELAVIRTHTYHTYHILQTVDALRPLAEWAAFHHERIDGNGYPFHVREDDLPLRSRIMSVADVFTALTEDRPYRKALPPSEVMSILRRMAADGALDKRVVEEVASHYEELDTIRANAQQEAAWEYMEIGETRRARGNSKKQMPPIGG